MKLRPLHDRVIVKRLEQETKTASGIVIPDSQHFTLVGLFGGVVGDDDARSGLGFILEALDDHAIVQRTKFH